MKRMISIFLAAACLMPAHAAEPFAITKITADSGSISLAWNDVGADRYEICRSLRRDGVYVKIAETGETAYIDTGLRQNRAYFYRIRACWETGGAAERSVTSAPQGRCCVDILEAFAEENRCYRLAQPLAVRGLMLHSLGCAQERASVVAAAWNQPAANVLVHAIVEPGGTVYQLSEWEKRCWHSGGSGNAQYIGVEMTEPSELRYTSGTSFSYSGDARETAMDNYNTAVALFANLCFTFSLDPLTDIVSHAEGYLRGSASAHADPEHLWNGLSLGVTMDTFRSDVASKMEGTYSERTAPPLGAYTVRAEVLNIRSGPGTEYAVVGTLEAGAALTVCGMEQSGSMQWGRTDGGWVSLNYVS